MFSSPQKSSLVDWDKHGSAFLWLITCSMACCSWKWFWGRYFSQNFLKKTYFTTFCPKFIPKSSSSSPSAPIPPSLVHRYFQRFGLELRNPPSMTLSINTFQTKETVRKSELRKSNTDYSHFSEVDLSDDERRNKKEEKETSFFLSFSCSWPRRVDFSVVL